LWGARHTCTCERRLYCAPISIQFERVICQEASGPHPWRAGSLCCGGIHAAAASGGIRAGVGYNLRRLAVLPHPPGSLRSPRRARHPCRPLACWPHLFLLSYVGRASTCIGFGDSSLRLRFGVVRSMRCAGPSNRTHIQLRPKRHSGFVGKTVTEINPTAASHRWGGSAELPSATLLHAGTRFTASAPTPLVGQKRLLAGTFGPGTRARPVPPGCAADCQSSKVVRPRSGCCNAEAGRCVASQPARWVPSDTTSYKPPSRQAQTPGSAKRQAPHSPAGAQGVQVACRQSPNVPPGRPPDPQ
jgi:hypothetical protein